MNRQQWMSPLKRNVLRGKIKTRGDELGLDKALVVAFIKRKILLESMLEDIQHIPDEVVDEDNAYVPYGLSNELHYHYRQYYIHCDPRYYFFEIFLPYVFKMSIAIH